jgi:uncharacterized protein with PQ loop repeat
MRELALVAGMTATTLFVVSYLPMLHRAMRTRELSSYSRPSLVLANVGNVIQSLYVYSLPAGPIWLLHSFYLGASAFMLRLHLRHIPGTAQLRASKRTLPIVGSRRLHRVGVNEGGRHDDDNN